MGFKTLLRDVRFNKEKPDVVEEEHDEEKRSKSPEERSDQDEVLKDSEEPGPVPSDEDFLDYQNEEVIKHPDTVTEGASRGVQKVEAVALVWSRPVAWILYAWIFICFFMLALQSTIGSNLLNVAYNDFKTSNQINVANVVSSIVSAIIRLPIGKSLNVFGRAETLTVFLVVYVVGLIIISACNGPSAYAAGYVLFEVGNQTVFSILDIFVADFTGLRNRAWAWAGVSLPYVCTTFVSGLIANSLTSNDLGNWRWGYGMFAVIIPFVIVPVICALFFFERKAIKLGILEKRNSGRTLMQELVHHFHEFDIIGCIILMGAFLLFLLPFNLHTYSYFQSYSSAEFIALVVVGICLFPVFIIWEKYFTRVHFIRWELLKKRDVVGPCGWSIFSYASFYCWDLYFFYFNSVVYNLNTRDATYMNGIYSVGSVVTGFVYGAYIRWANHYKYSALFFGLPIEMLGAGFMIHFRGQGGEQGTKSEAGKINYVIMSQIFIAVGGGVCVIANQMSAMAAADHDGIAMTLSVFNMFANIGDSIGQTIAASIQQTVFPRELRERLPEPFKPHASEIYANNGPTGMYGQTNQTTFPIGSPQKIAIDQTWGESQKWGAVAGVAMLAVAWPFIAIWRNHDVRMKQNKGKVI